jgi:tetratricopeptide (TPR) repeat protein
VVTLAGATRERGDLTHASRLLNQLLLSLGSDATRRDRGSALWNAAVIAAERGQFADGILLAERALALFAEEDDIRAESLLRTNLAWMLLDAPQPDPDQALTLLSDAHTRLSQAGMQIELAYTETELARAHTQLGDPDHAIRWARSSLDRLGDNDRLETARARLALARALLLNNETTAAVQEMQNAASSLEHSAATRQAAAVWRELAELFVTIGDLPASNAAFTKALDLLGLPRPPQPAPDHPAFEEPRRQPGQTSQPQHQPTTT